MLTTRSLIFGAIVGVSMGLTGAVAPFLLCHSWSIGLGVPTRDAIGSVAQVDGRTGTPFAITGMLGAPVGAWVAGYLPEPVLLSLFGGLMAVVAVRMWLQSSRAVVATPTDGRDQSGAGGNCQRDETDSLILNTRCTALMLRQSIAAAWRPARPPAAGVTKSQHTQVAQMRPDYPNRRRRVQFGNRRNSQRTMQPLQVLT